MPIKKHLPDPRTDRFRKRQFRPVDDIHIPRKKLIEHIDSKSKGINIKLMKRAIRSPEIVERKGKKAGLSRKEILQKQEQLVSRIASKYVDHLISGMKEKGLIEHNISPEDERKIWIQSYDEFVNNFFLKHKGNTTKKLDGTIAFGWARFGRLDIKKRLTRKKIVDEMDRAISFVLPPKSVIARRKKRQKYSKKAWELIKNHVNPESNLKAEIARVIAREYSAPNKRYTKDQEKIAKALHVCIAVSIYADIMERTRGENWTTAYTNGMLLISPQIEKNKEIETLITNFDKVEIY